MAKLKKVSSLGELRHLAHTDERYKRLLFSAHENLGGVKTDDVDKAMQNLNNTALETDEDGVIGEVNFCRDLVT